MNILGIAGSPRKGGNTDLLLTEALNSAAQKGGKTEKLYLDDLKIRPCRACMVCKSEGVCAVEDDMQTVTEKVKEAEAVIVATPVYWFSCSAQTKAFVDRLFALLAPDYSSQLQGKKGALIAVCAQGDPSVLIGVEKLFADIFAFNGMDYVGKVLCPGLLEQGAVKTNQEALARARDLGKR
ncbi:MAG: flavodoxin family protein, partial [Deltaproteobacteria bacterium]|nr:flavodoxin family protein [Deltaproteobacteria bacterium]